MQANAIDTANAQTVPTIIAPRVEIFDAMKLLCTVIERRNTIPVLSGVLVAPLGEGNDVPFRVIGTDLDLEAAADIAGVFSSPRPFVIASATAFRDALKAMECDDVMLELHGDVLKLSGDGSAQTLATLPADDFPRVAPRDWLATFAYDGRQFATDIARVSPAISTEETRYYLNGIYMHRFMEGPGAQLRLVATDGHRLHVQDRPFPADVDQESFPHVIIPRKAIATLAKLVGKPKPEPKSVAAALRNGSNPDVHIALAPSAGRFTVGRVTLVSKMIDGSFPDYTRVIPTHNSRRLDVDGKRLAALADKVTAASNVTSPDVGLEIAHRAEGPFITLSHRCEETGKASAELEAADWPSGAVLEIGFRARYLGDILGAIGDTPVTVMLEDAACPSLFTADAVPGFRAVLMPTRLGFSVSGPDEPVKPAEPPKPVETPEARFTRVYSAAYANRDREGMEREIERYADALYAAAAKGYGAEAESAKARGEPGRPERLTVASAAQFARNAVDKPTHAGVQRSHRYMLQAAAVRAEMRDFVTRGLHTGVTSACFPGFKGLSDFVSALAQLNTLPGYDPADARPVLALQTKAGDVVFVRADDLRNPTLRHVPECDAKGSPVKRKRTQPYVYRETIVAVVPPKLTAGEQSAKLYRLERENADLREGLARLEARIADVAGAPPPPAPEPVADHVADAGNMVAPEPVPNGVDAPALLIPAYEPEPEPSTLGAVIADLAARLDAAEARADAAEAKLASRTRTAGRLRKARAAAKVAKLIAAGAEAAADAARGEALEACEARTAMAGRLGAVEGELARLQPLAAAITALAQPRPDLPPPPAAIVAPVPDTVDA